MAPKYIYRAIALLVLGFFTLLSAMVPPEELEATKPQLEIHKQGDNLRFDWEAHPEVYYFFEGSPNLEDWITAKLLKDNDASGQLSLGTAISGSKGFYRLSLEGDPDAQRLREDSDGDYIINLLEVQADWDAFLTNTSADSDSDGIPDYFEEFHFGTLDHDGSYVAVTDGLTLAEAYSNSTNPNSADSDGDGWTDKQELAWIWNLNYDQSREDGRYSQAGDFDGDGISNSTEVFNNTDPSDSGDCPNGMLKGNYVLIDLGQHYYPIKVGNNGHVFMVNEGEGPYYRRWHWGAELDFERYTEEWGSDDPFVPGYLLHSMNNHGQIGGKYVSREPVSDRALVVRCGIGPSQILRYAPITRNTEDPVIIEADGTVSIQTTPSLPVSYSSDTEMHEIRLLNDNGDYVVLSSGSAAGFDGIVTSSDQILDVNINISGNFSRISSLLIQGIRVLRGSCDGIAQFSGEMPRPTHFNNQGKVAGSGYESAKWRGSPWLQSGTKFFFVGSVSSRVSYRPADLNQNGWVVGWKNGTYALYIDSIQHALPAGISGGLHISSPGADEHLIMVGSEHIAIQRKDTGSGNLIPFSSG